MQGWDIQQIDIKTAFLHGVLPEDETAYLEQPKGFEEPGKEGWVMRLMKSIYRMKQAGCICVKVQRTLRRDVRKRYKWWQSIVARGC